MCITEESLVVVIRLAIYRVVCMQGELCVGAIELVGGLVNRLTQKVTAIKQ
jgi:hypothetical protein